MFFPDVFVVPWFTGVDVSAELGDQIGYIMVQAGYLALALKYILTFWAFMAEIIDGVNVFLKLTALELADARGGPARIQALGQFVRSGVKLRAVVGFI